MPTSSSADFVLGNKPKRFTMPLTKDADFVTNLHNKTGDWPAGCEFELRFNNEDETTWTATVTGPDAVFNENYTEVNPLVEEGVKKVRLYYKDGGLEVCFALGEVKISE